METVVKENAANLPMKNPPYVLGEVQAPDYHPEPEIYSHYKATKNFNQISQDIFVKQKKEKRADRKKTPVGVWCTLLAVAGIGVYKTVKHMVFKK